mmetsp:Transcript_112262/g.317541  ORF Transcript_112262/g.317541 Transcript_112262/m.317541 type:complete len:630 (+) Transcript_112262:4722-6611(+)
MQQVDLIDDDEPHKLRVCPLVASLARDDVPFLRRRHDDLGLVDLGFREVDIPTKLPDDDAVTLEPLLEALDHFLHQRLHRRHVDALEPRQVKGPVLEPELRHNVEDAEHGHIRLAAARGGADEQVLRVLREGNGEDLALHVVQLLGAREGLLAPRRQLGKGNEVLRTHLGHLEGLHVHLLVALFLHAEGAAGQLALGIRHVVAALVEGQALEVQHVRGLLLLFLRDLLLAAAAEASLVIHCVSIALAGAPHLELPDLLPQVPRDVALTVALLRGTVQLLKHRLRVGRLAHVLKHGVLLLLSLRLTEPGAVQDLEAVLQQQLRELEVLVLQHLHQPVLALLQVLDGQDRQDLLLGGDALVGVMEDLAQLALQPMRVDLLDVDDVLALFFFVLLLLLLVNRCHVDAALILVILHLATALLLVVVALVADLAQPVSLLLVLVVFIEDNRHTCRVVQPLLRPNRVVLLLVLDVRSEVRDLLREAEELGEVLVGDGAQHLLDVLLALRVQHALSLDGREHLVGGAPEDIGGLVPERNLQPVQQLLVDCLGLLGPRPVDLHLRDVGAQDRLPPVDVHLRFLLDHGFAPPPLLLRLPLLLLLELLQLLGPVVLHKVAHLVVHPAAQRLGLTRGLIL